MEQLIQQESEDPYNLEIKQQLIHEYRKINYIVEAAEVRERYIELSPLPEPLWLEWLEDFSSDSLYSRALKDFYCNPYLDPKVLRLYLAKLPIDKCSEVFFLARRFTRDMDCWLCYISKLEIAEEIRNEYKELFMIPRPELERAWKQYESWEVNGEMKAKTHEIYMKSFADWLIESEHYTLLNQSFIYSTAQLKSYVNTAKLNNKNYIYEEVLYKHPNIPDIWEEYIIHNISDKTLSLRLCKRGLRNNPACISLWSYLILLYEQSNKSFQSNVYIEKLAKALNQPFEEGSSFTRIWKEYSQSLCRQNLDGISILIQAEQWLEEYCPPQHLVIKAHRATVTKNIDLFEELVKQNGSLAAVWEVYLKFLEENHDKSIRQVFRRAVEYTKDNVQSVINRYIEWEQRSGSLENLIQAKVKCKKRLIRDVEAANVKGEKFKMKSKEILTKFTGYIGNLPMGVKEFQLEEIFRQVVRVKAVRIVRDRKGNSRGFAYCDFDSQEELDKAVRYFNGKEIQGNYITIAVSKPPEEDQNESNTIFVNNLPYEITEQQIRVALEGFGGIKSIRIIKNADGKCKGFAYVEYFTSNSAENAVNQNSTTISDRKVLLEKFQNSKDQKFILHVSNLPYTLLEEDLLKLFPKAISVNIPRDKIGKSRGFAFVEFNTERAAQDVLEDENPCLEGRYLVIKRSYKKLQEKKELANSDFKKFLA